MLKKSVYLEGIKKLQIAFDYEFKKERRDFFYENLKEIEEQRYLKIINKIIWDCETNTPKNLLGLFNKNGFYIPNKTEKFDPSKITPEYIKQIEEDLMKPCRNDKTRAEREWYYDNVAVKQ